MILAWETCLILLIYIYIHIYIYMYIYIFSVWLCEIPSRHPSTPKVTNLTVTSIHPAYLRFPTACEDVALPRNLCAERAKVTLSPHCWSHPRQPAQNSQNSSWVLSFQRFQCPKFRIRHQLYRRKIPQVTGTVRPHHPTCGHVPSSPNRQ